MNKRQLPEHMRDLSGTELKEAMIAHKKNEIVKLVCRQTDYTEDIARNLLEKNKYNYMNIIKEWINPSSKATPAKKDKPSKSINQRMIGEIRNFMDQGYKLTQYRKKQKAYMMRLQELRKKQKEKEKEKTKLNTIHEENKKI